MIPFVLDPSGKCSSCSEDATQSEIIRCEKCKKSYHALCTSAADKHEAICNQSLLKIWHQGSTKNNFKWFCDVCLTEKEHCEQSDLQTQLYILVQKVNELTDEVKEIKSSVVEKHDGEVSVLQEESVNAVRYPNYGGPWSNTKNVENLKASLMVKATADKNSSVTLENIEKIVVQNKIPVSRVGVSTNGNTYIHCPTKAARDKLMPLLGEDLPAETVQTLKEKLPSISIVGITKEVSKEDLLLQICNQNEYISELIKQGNVFNILFVKSPSEGYTNYQVVVRVSPAIRNAIAARKNRLFLGVTALKVFDRFYVKRCNKCNCFGHYKSDCPNTTMCGYCMSKDHESNNCPLKASERSADFNCSNCHKAGLEHVGHSALWFNCPSYKTAQKRLQSSIPYYESVKNLKI